MLPYQEMRPFEHDPEQEHFKRSTLAKVVGCLAFSALAISGIFGNSLVNMKLTFYSDNIRIPKLHKP